MAEYYRIKKETLVGLASNARRLGNVEGELSIEQMKAIFTGVSAGGSGGTVIPDNAGVFYRVSAQSVMNMSDFDFDSSAV